MLLVTTSGILVHHVWLVKALFCYRKEPFEVEKTNAILALYLQNFYDVSNRCTNDLVKYDNIGNQALKARQKSMYCQNVADNTI